MDIPFEHLLALGCVMLFVAILVTSQIAAIRRRGYNAYYEEEYRLIHPDHSRDDFTLYIYSSFCFAAILYSGSLISFISGIRKII